MITAIDTSVLLDVFGADPAFGPGSKEALRACFVQGQLVICDVVWAELAASFPSESALRQALEHLGVEFTPVNPAAASLAGAAWKKYRQQGGSRLRIIPDFLIGAHAVRQADRLLTRDRGFFRTYFKGLEILDPSR